MNSDHASGLPVAAAQALEETVMEEVDALVFVDTNIFLDFYRIRSGDVSSSYLELIDSHRNRIITGSQVAMEYKKNRQRVILETIRGMRKPDWNALGTPALLQGAQAAKMIEKKRGEVSEQQNKLKEKIAKILKNPTNNDPVYQCVQRLFKHSSPYNLNRTNKVRFEIRELACKRWVLGYPPRKKDDNAIGDAINWEWIIRCAVESKKDIIIVTRDTDFGVTYEGSSILNDWLHQEFKERVSRKRHIYITDRLSKTFKALSYPVSEEMEQEEDRILSEDAKASNEVYGE